MSHAPHADANDPFQKFVAVALAVFTVLLALSNMLGGGARTAAIITTNKATGKWSHYQSKSSKQIVLQSEITILSKLLPPKEADAALAKSKEDVERYEREKAEIQSEAVKLEGQAQAEQHKEHQYEYSATIAELAIILGGIALLMHSKKALYLSAAIASGSLLLIAVTFLSH
jgi:hypothetical protein